MTNTQQQSTQRIFASPLARRIAAEKGIDLSDIKGSGPHGRIIRADIDNSNINATGNIPASDNAVIQSATTQQPVANPVTTAPKPAQDAKQLSDLLGMEYVEEPNNNIKKVVASRLLESKQTVPHFYLTVDCRIDELLATRKKLNDKATGEFKLSVNDFIIKACANALHKYPDANVAWTDDAILKYKNADISVAVATPNGLITPIIKNADKKGLREISEEMKDLASRAREGKLKPEEFQGGTFSISNLGMYGIKEFSAIINPPQACILAVGAGIEQPVVDNGELSVGTIMSCTLSVDHRAVDGAIGAEFLQILKQYIEDPASMLL
jgi:pyruvate dehydrogenase E2 component (dihydrolipoamide acetyltransferase)